jgi:hypothetical protein
MNMIIPLGDVMGFSTKIYSTTIVAKYAITTNHAFLTLLAK